MRFASALIRQMLSWSPGVLAAVSGYYLVFLIVPFFLLGIYRVPDLQLASGQVSMAKALGQPAAIVAFLMEMCMPAITYVWLFSLINFAVSRRWTVLVILVLAPQPIAYALAGPYACQIKDWVFAL